MAPVLLNQGIDICPTVTDSIDVELRNITTYSVVASTRVLLQTNGNAYCRFPDLNGNYYIVIKHKNAFQTWSQLPVPLSTAGVTTYDFSLAANKPYGDNMVQIENGFWAFYSGDLNFDENADLIDLGLVEQDINDFAFGYKTSDLNGDGNVDLLDSPVIETNITNFIFSVHP